MESIQEDLKSEDQHKGVRLVLWSEKVLPTAFNSLEKNLQKNIQELTLGGQTFDDEMYDVISNQLNCIIAFAAVDKKELSNVLKTLLQFKESLQNRKIVAVLFTKNITEATEEALKAGGIAETFKWDLNQKAFIHKLKRYVARFKLGIGEENDVDGRDDLLLAKAENSNLVEDSSTVKSIHKSQDIFDRHSRSSNHQSSTKVEDYIQSPKTVNPKSKLVLTEPVSCPMDYWILRQQSHIKRYLKYWMFEFIGPSPAAGSWAILTIDLPLFSKGDVIWIWVPRDHTRFQRSFHTDPGYWAFVGKRPEYSWVVNRWAFLSSSPEFVYIENGKKLFTRLSIHSDGDLYFAKNCQFALGMFEQIKETFYKDYYLKLIAEESKSHMISADESADIPWSDRSNSNDLTSNDWHQHDLSPNASKQLELNSQGKITPQQRRKQALLSGLADLDIPLGANAMAECGVLAYLGTHEVELHGYAKENGVVILGMTPDQMNSSVKIGQVIEVQVKSTNLKTDLSFTMKGEVIQIDDDEAGGALVQVVIQGDSGRYINQIRETIMQRQEEIFAFFKKAKGLS
jgi:hypothetical protein